MMLFLSNKLNNMPLLGIRTANRIGTVVEPIINPHNLHVDGFFCKSSRSTKPLILLDMMVRDFSPAGIIANEIGDLSEPEDLVRLQPILKLNFKLEGKMVIAGKKKLGKVAEYAIDKDSLLIQKLYVQTPVWKNINQDRLIIDRKSILEVTQSHVKVSGPEEKAKATVKPAKAPLLAKDYSVSASLTDE